MALGTGSYGQTPSAIVSVIASAAIPSAFWYCLLCPLCESVTLDALPRDETMQETVQRLGLGAISDLRRINDGPFEIHGEFGVVCIDSERPLLRLRNV